MHNLPPIGDNYFKNIDQRTNMTREELEEYIKSGRITGKVTDRLFDRKAYKDKLQSPHHYFPFNPLKY